MEHAAAFFGIHSKCELAGRVAAYFADERLRFIVERGLVGEDGAEALLGCEAQTRCEERCEGEVGGGEPVAAQVVAMFQPRCGVVKLLAQARQCTIVT